MKAESAMILDVFYLSPENDLEEAYGWMQELAVRHMPIMSDGKLCGILSDRDVLLYARMEQDILTFPPLPVSRAMTEAVFTCHEDTRIGDIADLMIEEKIDALPIVDDAGQLKGMITSTDLLGLLRRSEGVTDRDLVPYVFQLTVPPSQDG